MAEPHRKMLFVSMSDRANGAENVLLTAAKLHGSPMIFLKKEPTGALLIPDGQCSRYISTTSMVVGFLKLAAFLKPYRSNYIIMSSHPYLNAYLGFLKRIGYLKSQLIVRECTVIFIRYSGLKKWSYKLAYFIGYPAVDLIVCQTKLMRQSLIKHIGFVRKKKVIVLDNPVDIPQVKLNAEAPLYDPDASTGFICAAGRLIPEKGFSVLIQAFGFIEKQYPNLKLLIFGEGPEKQSLIKLIATQKLEKRVILKGWTSNPMPYFKEARVCVVSSITEGFPNVLLQMMILNRSVVSTVCADGIAVIPGILKAEVNSRNSLSAILRTALNQQFKYKEILAQQYLQRRTPEVFVDTLLKLLK